MTETTSGAPFSTHALVAVAAALRAYEEDAASTVIERPGPSRWASHGRQEIMQMRILIQRRGG